MRLIWGSDGYFYYFLTDICWDVKTFLENEDMFWGHFVGNKDISVKVKTVLGNFGGKQDIFLGWKHFLESDIFWKMKTFFGKWRLFWKEGRTFLGLTKTFVLKGRRFNSKMKDFCGKWRHLLAHKDIFGKRVTFCKVKTFYRKWRHVLRTFWGNKNISGKVKTVFGKCERIFRGKQNIFFEIENTFLESDIFWKMKTFFKWKDGTFPGFF